MADRIEIADLKELSAGEYQVTGEIIEVTSTEKANGGAAAKQSIVLVVERSGDGWLISKVTLGDTTETTSIEYQNVEYGFTFALPRSWTGYSIVDEQWEGSYPGGTKTGGTAPRGPLVLIRHPKWTAETPRQDIPVMVFTLSQWDSLQKGDFHIGAAPMGPTELARNNKYVFALPARYNYSFPEGYEEVEDILEGHPLRAREIVSTP